ncbi:MULTISPECIES: phage holin family protein [unclassified Clostridium]|uniref:phage holin family protein n=1 Tax=unclassified Clostridium TaxID=2614128 RepID=UPI0002972E4A|nr:MULTISPECIES: phage holin family protein [unclassified Clostridium]EKQ57205.1 MAG: Phage holin [Clostridium sp. Maddingley MBC34-26]
MDLVKYITENALILVPTLYVVGMIIKNTEKIPDKYIPGVLLILGVAGALALMGLNANAAIQGILVTGATVYTNQLIKQNSKEE